MFAVLRRLATLALVCAPLAAPAQSPASAAQPRQGGISAQAQNPAPKANLIRVVVNGELCGLYVNQRTFSKRLLAEQLDSGKGTR